MNKYELGELIQECLDKRYSVSDIGNEILDGRVLLLLDGDLLETFAAIEHEQWMAWAKTMLEGEVISPDRAARWLECMEPYDALTEEQKEQDRFYARKVISAIKNPG